MMLSRLEALRRLPMQQLRELGKYLQLKTYLAHTLGSLLTTRTHVRTHTVLYATTGYSMFSYAASALPFLLPSFVIISVSPGRPAVARLRHHPTRNSNSVHAAARHGFCTGVACNCGS